MHVALAQYKAGDFEKVARSCQHQIKSHPRDVTAHYLLGDALLRMNQKDEALKQFYEAEKLDPRGNIGAQCRRAILFLSQPHSAIKQRSKTPDAILPPVPGEPDTDTSDTVETKEAAFKSSRQMSSRCEELASELESEIARVQKEADIRIEYCMGSWEAKIQANGQVAYRGRIAYSLETQNAILRAQRDEQVRLLRKDAEKKIDSLKALYRDKQSAVEDSTYNIHKSYEAKNQQGQVILSPNGTNLNVRNYQTTDSVSHDVVPLIASPKAFVNSKSKAK